MQLPVNRFKQAIKAGRPQIGIWNSLTSNVVAEVIAPAGYDWALIDLEHAPNTLQTLLGQLEVYDPTPTTSIVRPAWNDPVMIKQILDLGANSLLFPMIQTAEEAKRAVASTRYPPKGIRGVSLAQRHNRFGRYKDYFQRIEDELCVLVQIETKAALGRLEEIAAVDGVDGLFFGPADLSADFGYLGQPGHPEVRAALEDAVARCKKVGKPAGILTAVEADAKHFLKKGYTFVAVGSDSVLLTRAVDGLLQRMREG